MVTEDLRAAWGAQKKTLDLENDCLVEMNYCSLLVGRVHCNGKFALFRGTRSSQTHRTHPTKSRWWEFQQVLWTTTLLSTAGYVYLSFCWRKKPSYVVSVAVAVFAPLVVYVLILLLRSPLSLPNQSCFT